MAEDRVMSPEEQEEELANFHMEIGQELQAETPFLGEIRADEVGPGKFSLQWHLAVLPLDFQLRGKTGMFHEYYKPSNQLRSKCGAALAAFSEHKILPKGTTIGKGELVGTVCWWVKRDIRFGRGSDGQPMMAEGVLIPVKKATPEEQARAGTVQPFGNGHEPAEVAQAPAGIAEWTDDQVNAVVGALVGLKPTEFQKAVLDRNNPASRLPRDLKQAVINGTALRYLIDNNKVLIDTDGTIGV